MASYPTPYHTFKYAYQVAETGKTTTYYTYFQVEKNGVGGKINATVYDDIPNGANDSPSQLGDVSPDQFHVYSSTLGGKKVATYTGVYENNGTDDPSEIVANVSGIGYVLFSDHKLSASEKSGTFGIDADPYILCFATGTLIRTSRGEIAVEQLAVGDLALTASGELRPIRWLGHRTIDCRAHTRSHDAKPVRVAAHAFGAGLPARDLVLSPGHPVLVGADEDGANGHLVPIMCLINGTTIARVEVDSVTYWHIELDSHDILLAEGLPAESYLDWGDRSFFTEGSDHALHNPDFVVPGLGARCRPVAVDGPVVEAERRRLDMAFAARLAMACGWPEEASAG